MILHHDGSITVGNDSRDIEKTFNAGRWEILESGRQNALGDTTADS
ncbi:hypothetical protein [Nocardia sp. NPDC051833]